MEDFVVRPECTRCVVHGYPLWGLFFRYTFRGMKTQYPLQGPSTPPTAWATTLTRARTDTMLVSEFSNPG